VNGPLVVLALMIGGAVAGWLIVEVDAYLDRRARRREWSELDRYTNARARVEAWQKHPSNRARLGHTQRNGRTEND